MHKLSMVVAALAATLSHSSASLADGALAELTIPSRVAATARAITIEDVTRLRHIDTLSVSPDGRRFAISVRQGDSAKNAYRTAWFVGRTDGRGQLVRAGDGGEVGPGSYANGEQHGEVRGSQSAWSSDGLWISYVRRAYGELQIWRSRVDGSAQEQVTHNAGDVQDFVWSADGSELYFTTSKPRAELLQEDVARTARGYRYDDELNVFTDAMTWPAFRPVVTAPMAWILTAATGQERSATVLDRSRFEEEKARRDAGVAALDSFYKNSDVSRLPNSRGAIAWLVREKVASRRLRVAAAWDAKSGRRLCERDECSGVIPRLWWSANGERIVFWRMEGVNERTHAFYAWSPVTNKLTSILKLHDDDVRLCMPAADDRLVCARETPNMPAHVAAIDLGQRTVSAIADVNPEFESIQLGRVERYEWELPVFSWNEPGGELAGLYGKRAYGYILYPPGFDPRKKYPVFIDPYIAHGFNRQGSEHPLHVYAANGFVVLNMAFPFPNNEAMERLGPKAAKEFYSSELGYPDMAMLMESTVRGLGTVAKRGFIDEQRVGIGGVSTGTFVPLYMMQKYDRIAAISISSPHWGPLQYYWGTRKVRQDIADSYGAVGYEDFVVKPEGAGKDFWSGIDIADHIDSIEAPILMNLSDRETFALLRLIRHMEDGGKPYDAYIFPNETHVKWQPAHLHAIMVRNLDWFRFWLQDYQDGDAAKADQYERWRKLRAQREADRVRTSAADSRINAEAR